MPTVMRKPKRKSGATPSVTRSVVLPRELDEKLLRVAEREDRTLSYVIMRACRELVEREKP